MFKLLLVNGLFFGTVFCVIEIPKDYKRCKLGPEFNTCMVAALNDAFPKLVTEYEKLGLPQLEPFIAPTLKFDQQNGPVSMKQEFKDMHLNNFLLKTKVEKFNLDQDKHQIEFAMFKDRFDVSADCSLDGRILIVPIHGHGNCAQNFTGLRFEQKMNFKTMEKNGEVYWHFTSVETRMQMPTKIIAKFENLFNGNKELTDSTNQFINENWQDIFKELEPIHSQAFSRLTLKLLNKVFDQLPISKIFPE